MLTQYRIASVDSKILRPERVARFDSAFPVAGHEPALALRRGTVSEAVRHHPSGRLALQGIVADCGSRLHRRLNIAGFNEGRFAGLLEAVVLASRPYP